MKKIIAGLILCAFLAGCQTITEREKGELTGTWWNDSPATLENYYRQGAEGIERKVVLVVGVSDSLNNTQAEYAFDEARLNAQEKIAQRIVSSLVQFSQEDEVRNTVQQLVDEGIVELNQTNEVTTIVNDLISGYTSRFTTVQFSDLREVAFHSELMPNNRYKAWVAMVMTEELIEQTIELQRMEFQNLMEETEEFKKIMRQINERIAELVLERLSERSNSTNT